MDFDVQWHPETYLPWTMKDDYTSFRWHCSVALPPRESEGEEQKCCTLLAERYDSWLAGIWITGLFQIRTQMGGGGRTLDLFQGHVYGNLFSFCFVPKTSNKSDASPGTSSELSMLRSGLHLTRLKAHWYLAVIAISSPYSVHTISNRMLPVSRHLIEFGWGYLTSSVGPGRYSLKGPVQGSLSSSEALLPEGTTGPKIAPQR